MGSGNCRPDEVNKKVRIVVPRPPKTHHRQASFNSPPPLTGWLMVADAVPDCKEIEELLGGRVSRPFRSGFGLCPGTNSRKASFDGFLRRIWWCFCSREICCWSNGLDASLSRMLGQMHCVGLELSRVA